MQEQKLQKGTYIVRRCLQGGGGAACVTVASLAVLVVCVGPVWVRAGRHPGTEPAHD